MQILKQIAYDSVVTQLWDFCNYCLNFNSCEKPAIEKNFEFQSVIVGEFLAKTGQKWTILYFFAWFLQFLQFVQGNVFVSGRYQSAITSIAALSKPSVSSERDISISGSSRFFTKFFVFFPSKLTRRRRVVDTVEYGVFSNWNKEIFSLELHSWF